MKTAAHEGQLMLSIGALLASEREKRGIPVEKAAKETRMRPARLRDIEGDDLSHFTNPSYARMFIIAYAKYLGIPMKTIRDHLPDRGESGTEGYQYISTSTEDLPSLRHDIVSKPARSNSLLYTLAITTLAIVLISVCGLGYYLIVNAPRLQAAEAKAKLPPAPDPTPAPEKVILEKMVLLENVNLNNLQPNGEGAVAFQEDMAFAEPPASAAPVPAMVRRTLTTLTATTGPSPTPVPDDQAFLLGASPDQKPAPVQ